MVSFYYYRLHLSRSYRGGGYDYSVNLYMREEAMQIWNERKRLHNPTGFFWKTNIPVVVLFWDTNMACVTSCEKALY